MKPLPVATVLLTVLACDGALGATDPGAGVDVRINEFIELMNDHRVARGCPALQWRGDVADVAQAHSEDMVARGFFSHTNPDGQSPFDRLRAAGIVYRSAGENIASGFSTGQAVLDGWLSSPGHRANIEDCSYTHHGVGLEGNHWTHVFLTP